MRQGLYATADAMPAGRWRDRFVHALELSLRVLEPHRAFLRAPTPRS